MWIYFSLFLSIHECVVHIFFLSISFSFSHRFAKLVSEHNLTPDQIYNADETGLLYRCLPTSTLASEAEGAVKGFKQSKDRLTVLVCANMAGTHKVKLCVIGKYRKPRCFKNLTYLPVDYRAQSNAWMDAETFTNWFRHVFVPSVKENLKKKGLPEDSKVVLLLDNCKAHPPAEELSVGNIFVVYLPPNVTSLIQPMDQGVIQNFKVNYRRSFMRKLINYDEGSIPDFQRAFNVKDAIFMASLAWQDVKQQTLMRCWRKLYPLVMFEDEEGDDDFEGFGAVRHKTVVSELREMGGAAKLSVSDEALREWVDVDTKESVTLSVTDDEIVQSVLEEQHSKLTEADSEEEDDPEPKVSWQDAAKGLSMFVKFAEQSTYMNTHDVMSLHCLQNEFLLQRAKNCKQRDIRDYMKIRR